jgi:hypothetical protein
LGAGVNKGAAPALVAQAAKNKATQAAWMARRISLRRTEIRFIFIFSQIQALASKRKVACGHSPPSSNRTSKAEY